VKEDRNDDKRWRASVTGQAPCLDRPRGDVRVGSHGDSVQSAVRLAQIPHFRGPRNGPHRNPVRRFRLLVARTLLAPRFFALRCFSVLGTKPTKKFWCAGQLLQPQLHTAAHDTSLRGRGGVSVARQLLTQRRLYAVLCERGDWRRWLHGSTFPTAEALVRSRKTPRLYWPDPQLRL
jgi:hypothetical protein